MIELITVLAGAGVLAGLGKFLKEEYRCWKQRKLSKSNSYGLNSDVEIFKTLVDTGQEFNMNYSDIFALHNSGRSINVMSKKKLTLKWEFKAAFILPSRLHKWEDRKISGEIKRFINDLDKEEFIYIEDISMEKENLGIREIYNNGHGKELILFKLGWFNEDTFMFTAFQRDVHENMKLLTIRQRAFLKYKSEEIGELLTNINN